MQKKFTVLNLKMILRIFQQWKVCNLSSFTWKSFHLVDIRTFFMRNSIKILFHIDMVQNKENKIEEVGYNVCTMEWESENVWWVLQIHSRTFFMILDFIAIFVRTRMFIDTYDDQFSLNYVIKAYPSSLEEISWDIKKEADTWAFRRKRWKKAKGWSRKTKKYELLKSLNLSASSGTMILSMRMWIA